MKSTTPFGVLGLSAAIALGMPSGAAANSLQFNQTLLITGGTVPAGKTWKLESIAPENKTYGTQGANYCGGCCGSGTMSYRTDTNTCASANKIVINGVVLTPANLPLWLPAGSTIAVVTASCGGGGSPYFHVKPDGTTDCSAAYADPGVSVTTYYSILEFNVVP